MTTRLRDALDTDTPLGAAFSPPWLTFVGIGVAILVHIDPAGTAFYDTTAQVAAGLLIAFAIDSVRSAAEHPNPRWALSLHVGLALAIVEALVASLWAIGRGDGSVVLAGVTIGGLFLGVAFLIATTTSSLWRSAAVAGALGEDEVVGGGEGG